MSEKEYIVTLKKDVDYDAFNAEMIASTGAGDIPNRTVDVANARLLSKRNTHYALTDAEATALRGDSRVVDVQIPPQDRSDIEIGLNAVQSGSWKKDTSQGVSSDLNWGLVRGASASDPWGSGTSTITTDFKHTLTGKDVDVVIQDSGVQTDHPEFTDSAGISRIRNIDWYAESGVSGSQSANHNRDYDGHGSHCAGTVAGRTQGWARDANIYSVKVNGLEGTGDGGTGISVSDCFDVIKGWHNNKPINPKTGLINPTVVNASWGYGGNRGSDPTSGVFRGNSWTWSEWGNSDNNAWANVGVVPVVGLTRRINVRVASVDADLQECIDAGIIFCIAAGNSYYYIDVDGGPNWDDTANFGSGQEYLFRGSSPYDTEAFMVGNIDYTYKNGKEQKAESSCAGPGVGIYAPGTEIISVGSTDNASGSSDKLASAGGPTSPLDASYRLMKISGTSMASPQVAGMAACILEANPMLTPAQVKQYMVNNAKSDLLNDVGKFTPQSFTVDATNNSSSAYTLSNGTDRNGSVSGDNDSIAIKVGDTLAITNNASGSHPMYFKSAATTGTGDQVTSPAATGQGASGGGTVTWTPTKPGTFYYICSAHSAMKGTITVSTDIVWDDQDSIWGGNNKYFFSPLWDDEEAFSSNVSGNFSL